MNTENKIIPVYKEEGETPFQLVNRFRQKNNIPDNIKVAYAGRLDPLAKGVVLLVTGERLVNFDKQLTLAKEYTADIIFDFSTDTYDVMGLPKKENTTFADTTKIKNYLESTVGDYTFSLPPFSSYKIKGKPLFMWAREERLSEVEIPIKTVEVNSVSILGFYNINEGNLYKLITDKINKVVGDFRQEEILKEWKDILTSREKEHLVVSLKISCQSGFYVRSMANNMGGELNSKATLLNLERNRVGDYKIEDCLKI